MPAPPAVPAAPLGRPIKGPSALGDDHRRFLRLAWTLAVTDFKLRFFGSALGYLWQLIRPLALFGVLLVVFTQFLKLGTDVKYYPESLLLGIVLYNFFSEATAGSVRALVVREHLMRKVDFPRLAVILAVLITALFNLALSILPVFIFLLAAGGSILLTVWQMPFIVLFLAMFCAGLGMGLSALFVRYRDIEPIWDVVLQAGFYASPIFYTVAILQEKTSQAVVTLVMCNPFATALQQLRWAVIDHSQPTAVEALGGAVWLLVPFGLVALSLLWGWRVFSRRAPYMAEEL